MDAALKKGVVLLVLVFLGYYLVTNPAGFGVQAKNISEAVWSGLVSLFGAVIAALNAIFS